MANLEGVKAAIPVTDGRPRCLMDRRGFGILPIALGVWQALSGDFVGGRGTP